MARDESLSPARWLESEAVDGALSAAQIERWRQNGALLVHDLLPCTLIEALVAEAEAHYPAPGSDAAAQFQQFGSAQKFVFPSRSDAFNDVTLQPALLESVAKLLGVATRDLRLTQSDLWPKYGREPSTDGDSNRDQRIHCDYPNHMLVHPPPWERPAAVELIIYLSPFDYGGGTAVVPRQGRDDPAYAWPITNTPGVAGMRYVNDKAQAEAYLQEVNPEAATFRAEHLYARECHARYELGSVLFYRHDVWHRGTPVRDGALRLVQNLTFRRSDCDWMGTLHPAWSWSMYQPDQFMERLIARLIPEQRSVLGFPAPGDDYWCEATVDAVEARYAAHGIDMQPYRERL